MTDVDFETQRRLRMRNLRTIAALAALFLVPLAGSFILYYGAHWRPAGTTNHGALIQPARPLPDLALPQTAGGVARGVFKGHWTLVYVGAGACNEDCHDALLLMRQTRLALNQDMTRVERVFLVTSAGLDPLFLRREHAGLLALDASGPDAQPLLAQFPAAGRDHAVFVVDPLGNLMMRYDSHLPPHGLLEDLRKLLRLSHIG